MCKCTYWGTCPFLKEMMVGMPYATERLKKLYCDGQYTECARFQVYKALGVDLVPFDLYPSMKSRADSIIANGGEDEIALENISYEPSFLENLSKHQLVIIIKKLKMQLDQKNT